MKTQLDELNSEKDKKIELQKEEIRKLKDEQIKTDGEIEMLKKQLDEMKSEKDKEILQLKQNEEEKISLIRTDFSSQLESMKERINQLTEKTKEEKTTAPLASIRFLGNSNHKGLISMLENVTISATGYINKHDPITNIKTYDNNSFCNYYDGTEPKSDSDSIIKFDFGSSRRVDLYSYFIRSNDMNPTDQHPKSWRIEGSNDNCLWTKLDHRLNDEHLRGKYREYKEYNFECQEKDYSDENSRFRFIRFVQEDSWWDNHPYCVYLTYFELYGDVFKI